MRELISQELELPSGGDAYHDIGYGAGRVIGEIADGIGDTYQAAVGLTTDLLCWATGDC